MIWEMGTEDNDKGVDHNEKKRERVRRRADINVRERIDRRVD